MTDWLAHIASLFPPQLLLWLAVSSLFMFVGTLIAIPIILVRLPADYFDIRKPRPWMENHHPILRVVGHLVKNVVGLVFLLAGLAMLLLPGQGVLTDRDRPLIAGISREATAGSKTGRPADRVEHD